MWEIALLVVLSGETPEEMLRTIDAEKADDERVSSASEAVIVRRDGRVMRALKKLHATSATHFFNLPNILSGTNISNTAVRM